MKGAGPEILGTGAKFKRVPCQKSCRVNRALFIIPVIRALYPPLLGYPSSDMRLRDELTTLQRSRKQKGHCISEGMYFLLLRDRPTEVFLLFRAE